MREGHDVTLLATDTVPNRLSGLGADYVRLTIARPTGLDSADVRFVYLQKIAGYLSTDN